jgi:hypothetical protein
VASLLHVANGRFECAILAPSLTAAGVHRLVTTPLQSSETVGNREAKKIATALLTALYGKVVRCLFNTPASPREPHHAERIRVLFSPAVVGECLVGRWPG